MARPIPLVAPVTSACILLSPVPGSAGLGPEAGHSKFTLQSWATSQVLKAAIVFTRRCDFGKIR